MRAKRRLRAAAAIATLALMSAAPASAAGMTVDQFLAKAEPLAKRGMVAMMMSADAKLLGKEIGGAAQALRADQDAAVRAGRMPPACLPPKGKAKLDTGELLTYLRSIPPAQRSMPFRASFYAFSKRKYPCPA